MCGKQEREREDRRGGYSIGDRGLKREGAKKGKRKQIKVREPLSDKLEGDA